jgi:hypothetical protein
MGRIVARASSGVGLLFRIKPRDIKAGKSNALKMPATTVRMMPSSTEATKRIQKPPKRNARGPGRDTFAELLDVRVLALRADHVAAETGEIIGHGRPAALAAESKLRLFGGVHLDSFGLL